MYYKLYYCSICRHLVKNHNRLYAFLNSFEGTLLSLLYNEMVVQDIEAVKDRCSGMPLAKVAALPADHEAVELGAFISLLAFKIKFQDNIWDESGFWIKRYNERFLKHINKTFKKKEPLFAKFNLDPEYIEQAHQELKQLEEDERPHDLKVYLDQWAELFGYIMAQPFKGSIDEKRRELLVTLFEGLGRTINLIDSMTDLHEDHAAGSFNLILKTVNSAKISDRRWLEDQYKRGQGVIEDERAKLLPLLPRLGLRESFPIMQNILTHCLDNEMKKVFEFMVLKKKRSERLLFNCKDF